MPPGWGQSCHLTALLQGQLGLDREEASGARSGPGAFAGGGLGRNSQGHYRVSAAPKPAVSSRGGVRGVAHLCRVSCRPGLPKTRFLLPSHLAWSWLCGWRGGWVGHSLAACRCDLRRSLSGSPVGGGKRVPGGLRQGQGSRAGVVGSARCWAASWAVQGSTSTVLSSTHSAQWSVPGSAMRQEMLQVTV